MHSISVISSVEEFDNFIKSSENVLLCFSAPWCPPCRAMEGTLLNTAYELQGKASVIKIDPSKLPTIGNQYGIKNIPAFVFIVDYKVIDRSYGIQAIDNLTRLFA